MRIGVGAAAAWALSAAMASAQPAPAPEMTQLFISPFGEPFRAPAEAPYPVAAWFAEADANHDGALDPGEFRADAARFFARLDLNHDGVIDGAEIGYYEHRLVPEILFGRDQGDNSGVARLVLVQFGGPGGLNGGIEGVPQEDEDDRPARPQAQPLQGAAVFGLLGEPEPVTAADENFNGRITAAEFQHAADRKFRLLDTDGDGRITLNELPQTPIQRMRPRHQKR